MQLFKIYVMKVREVKVPLELLEKICSIESKYVHFNKIKR